MFASCLSPSGQRTHRGHAIIRALSLALLVGVLAGCSTVGLVYNRADELTYWWLDRYFDWDDPQSTQLRRGLEALHRWHRQQELPRYAAKLDDWAEQAGTTLDAGPICRAAQQAREAWVGLLMHTEPDVLALLATLKPGQLERMRQRMERNRRDWQSEWLDTDVEARLERRVKLWRERLEHFYGPLQPAQQRVLRERLAASVWDARRTDALVGKRQYDQWQTLQRLLGQPRQASTDSAALRALLQRSMDAPDANDRAYQARLLQEGCALVATLHTGANAEQRAHLARTLRDYAALARQLATQP